jgi:serine/threonine protein kinase
MNEVNLLKNLQSPSIVSYIDSFFTKGTLIIVMEYCEAGDLEYYINEKKKNSVAVNES